MDLKQSLNKMYSTDHNVGAEESETGHHDSLRLPQNISCRQSGLFRLYLIVTIPFDIFLPCQTGPLLASDSDLDYCSKLPLQVFSAVCEKHVGLALHAMTISMNVLLLFAFYYQLNRYLLIRPHCAAKKSGALEYHILPLPRFVTAVHVLFQLSKGTSISSKGIAVFDSLR